MRNALVLGILPDSHPDHSCPVTDYSTACLACQHSCERGIWMLFPLFQRLFAFDLFAGILAVGFKSLPDGAPDDAVRRGLSAAD